MTTIEMFSGPPDKSDDPNPFEAFDTIPPMLAFCHMQFGAEGLRALLQMFVDPASAPAEIKQDNPDGDWNRSYTSREDLERYAAELGAVGLPAVADIVMEYTPYATAPPIRRFRNFNGYFPDEQQS